MLPASVVTGRSLDAVCRDGEVLHYPGVTRQMVDRLLPIFQQGIAKASTAACILPVAALAAHYALQATSTWIPPGTVPYQVIVQAMWVCLEYCLVSHVAMAAVHVYATQERDLNAYAYESRTRPVLRCMKSGLDTPYLTAAFLAARRLAEGGPRRRSSVLSDVSGDMWRQLAGPCVEQIREVCRCIAVTFKPSTDVDWDHWGPHASVWKTVAADAKAVWLLRARQCRLDCSVRFLGSFLAAVKHEDRSQVTHYCEPPFGEVLVELLLLLVVLKRYLSLQVDQPPSRTVMYQLYSPRAEEQHLPSRSLIDTLHRVLYHLSAVYGNGLVAAIDMCPSNLWKKAAYGSKQTAVSVLKGVLDLKEVPDGTMLRTMVY